MSIEFLRDVLALHKCAAGAESFDVALWMYAAEAPQRWCQLGGPASSRGVAGCTGAADAACGCG